MDAFFASSNTSGSGNETAGKKVKVKIMYCKVPAYLVISKLERLKG